MGQNCGSAFCQERIKETSNINDDRSDTLRPNEIIQMDTNLMPGLISKVSHPGSTEPNGEEIKRLQGEDVDDMTLNEDENDVGSDEHKITMTDLPIVRIDQETPTIQPSQEEAILAQYSQDASKTIRFLDREDYQKGFLQLMSLEKIKYLAQKYQTIEWEQDAMRVFKPFLNKDEYISVYDDLFPRVQDNLKIIIVEDQNRIVFALHMIFEEALGKKSAKIYDLLINRNSYNQLEDPNEVIVNMVKALQDIGSYHQCDLVKIVENTVDADVLTKLNCIEVKSNQDQDTYWQIMN